MGTGVIFREWQSPLFTKIPVCVGVTIVGLQPTCRPSVFVLLDESCDKIVNCLSCLMFRRTGLCMVIEQFALCYVYIMITEYLHRVCSSYFELRREVIATGMRINFQTRLGIGI